MKILHLLKWLTPGLNSGGKIRSCELGKILASFADVDAIGFLPAHGCLDGTERDVLPYRNLFPIPLKKSVFDFTCGITGVLKGRPLRSSRFYDHHYRRTVEQVLAHNHYDAIQVEELPMMSMLGPLGLQQPLVYSAHNVESELSAGIFKNSSIFLRLLAPMEKRLTQSEEAAALQAARFCFAVSDNDKKKFLQLCGSNTPPIHVIPNCASARFQPSPAALPKKEIIATGCFGWRPNAQGIRWFAEQVVPYLKKSLPGHCLRIVGSDIGRHLARRLDRSGCCINRNVPDILPFLQKARVLAVPLHVGGGTRIKIIEAWAAGLPVVSTFAGADGLEYNPGSDILIADSPEYFAALVHKVATDDTVYKILRIGGLKRAEKLRWSQLRTKIETVYDKALINTKGL